MADDATGAPATGEGEGSTTPDTQATGKPDGGKAVDPGKDAAAAPEPAKSEPTKDTKAAKPIEQAHWRSKMPDKYREKYGEKLAKQAEKVLDPWDAIASAYEAQTKLSSGTVIPKLGKNASDEEKASHQSAVRAALGIPEDPKDYNIEIPEDWGLNEEGEERVKAFLEKMHQNGAPPAAASAALNLYMEYAAAEMQEIATQAKNDIANGEAELRRVWGKDYDANSAIANAAFAKYADDELAKLQAMTGKELGEALGNRRVGDHPAWLRLFAQVGRDTGESTTVYQTTREGQDLYKEAMALKRTPEYRRGDKATVARQQELLQRYTGEYRDDAAA